MGGDFNMAFDVLTNPPPFNLTLDGKAGSTDWPGGLCLKPSSTDRTGRHISDIIKIFITDEAPCMGGGLGSGGGFP
jgi:hypothetical protein